MRDVIMVRDVIMTCNELIMQALMIILQYHVL